MTPREVTLVELSDVRNLCDAHEAVRHAAAAQGRYGVNFRRDGETFDTTGS
jgi:hypothetical protein